MFSNLKSDSCLSSEPLSKISKALNWTQKDFFASMRRFNTFTTFSVRPLHTVGEVSRKAEPSYLLRSEQKEEKAAVGKKTQDVEKSLEKDRPSIFF